MENSGYFRMVTQVASEKEADLMLERGEVQFVASIPADFSRKLARGERPQLLVEADAKVMEAKAELHGVQQQCAHGHAEGMALCFQRTLAQALSEQQAKCLWDACMLQ